MGYRKNRKEKGIKEKQNAMKCIRAAVVSISYCLDLFVEP